MRARPPRGINTHSRQRLRVRGVVQGVGFRPFVYGLALRWHLAGFVGNDSSGVFIEVEGDDTSITNFARELVESPPPLAHIESVETHDIPATGEGAFVIVESAAQPGAHTLISPDLCVCDDCLHEMNDSNDRRYRYPFINCTNCGPRFTIIKDIPYDRPLTTMADFPMCAACAAEYHDPLNRRFHAQPNACPDCGPQVTFQRGDTSFMRNDAVDATRAALIAGEIVAMKGIGGFHLACDARDERAVMRLRTRKGRPAKPFAVMVRDLDMAREIAHIDAAEADLLTSRERPIVLLGAKTGALAESIAPGTHTVGVMLPYTPLHYLLVDRPYVMTSANFPGEPIIKDNGEALAKLPAIVDAFLLHDRDIYVHCDDSVMRVFDGNEYPVRRSRGYTPFPVKLPHTVPPVLAVGGELKSTFCLTRDEHAFMSQHIGDMQNLETLDAFTRAFEQLRAIFRVEPQAVACDMHPRYLSTRWARDFAAAQGIPLIEVQHHQAHIAAVIAEHAIDGPVIGFSYDGTGYGLDATVWGGEVFIGDASHFERVDHLPPMPLPGGDAAVKNPYRLALAYLHALGIAWDDDLPPVHHTDANERRLLRQQLNRSLNVVQTTSMGRLFDAVSALIGVRQMATYEAQAAIELEAIAHPTEQAYAMASLPDLFAAIVHDLRSGVSIARIAGRFHNAVSAYIAETSVELSAQHGLTRVVLSGGVFQNMTLLSHVAHDLRAAGFDVYTHRCVPANDGGLALGQAFIAALQMVETRPAAFD